MIILKIKPIFYFLLTGISDRLLNFVTSYIRDIYPRKNEVVEDLQHRVEDYSSVISDSVTNSILQGVGVDNQTPEVTRLISLAAQKFISDIAYEALQHCKMRGGGKDQKSKSSGRDRKYAMSAEDIVVALSDQGLTVKKPPYFSS